MQQISMIISRETAETACRVLRDLINDGDTDIKFAKMEAALDELETAFLAEALAGMIPVNKKTPCRCGYTVKGPWRLAP